MKKLAFGFLMVICACESAEKISPSLYNCVQVTPNTQSAPDAARYQAYIDNLVAKGIPGIILSIDHPEKGFWIGAAGMADIASNIPMQSCNISRAGSTVKTFTATAILMLAEQGKLSLDDMASSYLPPSLIRKIANADQATIKQMLNHTSGIYNYIQDVKFQTASLNDLTRVWQPEDLLQYAYGRDAYFPVGEGCQYSNTAYILLGMIIEKVSGIHFSTFFQQNIFSAYNLTFTSFDINDRIPEGLARGYVDLYSNGQIIETTEYSGWDYYSADGGLISNPQDLTRFMKLLHTGEILSPESLAAMHSWVPLSTDPAFFKIDSGLGLFRIETPYGDAYMHSGDAIGYYANMMYFPESGVSVAWQTNGNYGTLDKWISTKEAFTEIMQLVFE